MSKSKLQEVLEGAEVGTVRSYSGRGMYGASCLGLDTDEDIGMVISGILYALSGEDTADVADSFRAMRQDSMGRGKILYFPGTPFVSDDEDDEDDPHDCEGPSCCTPA